MAEARYLGESWAAPRRDTAAGLCRRSSGFRRPGYSLYLEPGIVVSAGAARRIPGPDREFSGSGASNEPQVVIAEPGVY